MRLRQLSRHLAARCFTLITVALNGLALGSHAALAKATPSGSARPYDLSQILYFSGAGAELGEQHGSAAQAEISGLVDDWLVPRLNKIPFILDWFARAKLKNMRPFIPVEFQAEIYALADVAGVDVEKVMIANAAPDITELAAKPFGCDTYVVMPSRSETGGMLLGRNLDYSDSDILRAHWRPTVFAKTGKLKILSIHLPGESGVLTAINEKGVMMARMTSYSQDMTSKGMPSMLLMRKVLEEARTTDEATRLYKALPRTVAVNIMVADGKTTRVLEVSAKNSAMREPDANGVLYSANHFATVAMNDKKHGPDDRWPILASRDHDDKPIGIDDVLDILERTGPPAKNILAVVADYSNHRLIFGTNAEGHAQAAAGPLFTLDWEEAFAQVP